MGRQKRVKEKEDRETSLVIKMRLGFNTHSFLKQEAAVGYRTFQDHVRLLLDQHVAKNQPQAPVMTPGPAPEQPVAVEQETAP